MSYPTSLEKIVGVDLSRRGLAKAAKVSSMTVRFSIYSSCYAFLILKEVVPPMQLLHTKLNSLPDSKIKSAVLYDGNIMKFDSQLHGFDIATCLEVMISPL